MKITAVLRITRSQQMSLINILVAYARSDEPQSFIDVVNEVETTTGELLMLVSDVSQLEMQG